MDFIAIDFEIANNNMNSACSLGMAFVKDNKIIDKKYFVIRPPVLELNKDFSKIHGLTLNDLENAPNFAEIWKEISHYIHDESLVIAHNAQFDMSVLKSTLDFYSLDHADFPYACSIPISTRACRGEGIGQSLKERTDRFGISLDNHHNALSDATACAELVIKSVETKNRKSIHSYLRTFPSINVRLISELKINKSFRKRGNWNFERVKVGEVKTKNTEFDVNHEFYGKNFVFTGNMQSISRKDAMQKVVDVGGMNKTAISSLTNYLVVGSQDKTIVGANGMSSKERKAHSLVNKGIDINIISEEEFLKFL